MSRQQWWDGLHKFWVMICTVQGVISDFHVELLLLLCHHLGNKVCWLILQAQILHWNEMHWSCAYPYFMIPFLDCNTMVFYHYSLSLLSWLFALAFGWPASLSTEVSSFFKQLCHSLTWVLSMASSKAIWIIWMVWAWVLPSFWQNLM